MWPTLADANPDIAGRKAHSIAAVELSNTFHRKKSIFHSVLVSDESFENDDHLFASIVH
jgi:hypothetical protein